MINTITMPALSPTMKEGKLAKWMVKKGDAVSPGDVICEIETDKALMEVEAVDEGIVQEILIPEGSENVKVNSAILSLSTDCDEPATFPTKLPASSVQPDQNISDQPPKNPIRSPIYSKEQKNQSPRDGNLRLISPLARRLAQENGINISSISGSGPHGRIIKRDIDKFLLQSSTEFSPQHFPTQSLATTDDTSSASDADTLRMFAKDSYESMPHDSMRKTIARRLQDSKRFIPHFYVSIDCNIDNLLSLRTQTNTAMQSCKETKDTINKISVNDLVLKAFALAMAQVPDANVSWTETSLLRHRHVDISVAVSVPGGIVTPIIRKADQKSVFDISSEMKNLSQRAKQRKLKPEEYLGGTTSVSNMGMLGVKSFCAVINPPQSTILAVGAGEQRPIIQAGAIKIATLMTVTLSADHRSVDGAVASELLSAFKEYIENPVRILL
ncbi:pyruvate dehydrogenase complex dihydrolipoamide acetyltransferase [Candidatus Liberibacter sp.]|uniref:pyruvate dehydrogenase complex dihydrolipoamide acetyltransferase n=1 Tax=Candidatus Liberibacter sp. TaxID=34022 RepID=UPI0015F62F14|nr:pyruvate dehydrogenase complex dihydrolipoamide acetyltransferase [Candidatus Liberibacter sp.]MBA5723802.1 pyruvate dehydrogenase complex dihydrolipoamide acetyltransferase [Candidatus Liberibacter sp.]